MNAQQNNTVNTATVTAKKRGRPSKKVAVAELVVQAEAEVKTIDLPTAVAESPAPTPVSSPLRVVEDDDRSLCEDDLLEEAVVVSDSDSEEEEDDETASVSSEESLQSTLSSIAEEEEEEDDASVASEESEASLPPLESDPIVLRAQITTLQGEVARLTKFNQDLQRRLEGERKQPKKKAEKAKAEAKAGKRKVTRAPRSETYAEDHFDRGDVLVWDHLKRQTKMTATYIGNNLFRGEYSFCTETVEGTLNAVADKMRKHLTLQSVNVWTTFKTADGRKVDALDLRAKEQA